MRRPCVVLSVLDRYKSMFFTAEAMERLDELADLQIDPDPQTHASVQSRHMLKDAEVVITAWETGELTDLLDHMSRLQMVIHSGGFGQGCHWNAGLRAGSENLFPDPTQR